MLSKQVLREVIVSNKDFIRKNVKDIIKREGVSLPESLNKAGKKS